MLMRSAKKLKKKNRNWILYFFLQGLWRSKEGKVSPKTELQLLTEPESAEGIDILSSLSYYARLRIIYNLLPLLTASSNARVISVLAGGRERGLDINDLELRHNYSIKK